MSRRARERGDKRERWEFQPHEQDWREERDQDGQDIPDREDDPPPTGTLH